MASPHDRRRRQLRRRSRDDAGVRRRRPRRQRPAPRLPPAAPRSTLTPVAEVDGAVDLAWRTGDPALYVVEQNGQIVRVDGECHCRVLDIDDLTDSGGEQGLLGLAFSPDGTHGYVNFTDNDGNTIVAELAVSERRRAFDRDSMRTVLLDRAAVPQPQRRRRGVRTGRDALHRHGRRRRRAAIRSAAAQNMGELLGKMLRIDPATRRGDLGYTIPADNPFVGSRGARGEIWSVGLRNPWRFSFDPRDGRPVDRRRRSGQDRGDRRRPGYRRPRRRHGPQLRLERLRGRRRFNAGRDQSTTTAARSTIHP